MRKYKSPTDMGISSAGLAITDDEIVCRASLEEIQRRAAWYQQMVDRGEGELSWVERCEAIEKKCLKYFETKGYVAS